jgi:hypothetical protein
MRQPHPEFGSHIPRRELESLRAYALTGSHALAAARLGINEQMQRHRIQRILLRTGARSVGQAVWLLREDLEKAA